MSQEGRYWKPSYDELFDLYVKQGLSTTQIAEQFNVGITVVLTRLREHAITVRPKGGRNYYVVGVVTKEELATMTNREIGDRHGISPTAVYKLRKRLADE